MKRTLLIAALMVPILSVLKAEDVKLTPSIAYQIKEYRRLEFKSKEIIHQRATSIMAQLGYRETKNNPFANSLGDFYYERVDNGMVIDVKTIQDFFEESDQFLAGYEQCKKSKK